ncbi:MAG: deoxyribonuclease IV [Tepidanaerobacteraceae bacterium]|jgi:deoxyribonuclease-4
MLLGAHISISKGYYKAIKQAVEIGANTLQFFSRNPRGSAAKALDMVDIRSASEFSVEKNFGPLVSHAPYTINLGSSKKQTRDFAIMVLKEDQERLNKIGATYLVLHPGSHLGDGINEGIYRISSGLKEAVTDVGNVMILLEGMAGSGSEVGYTFEQLYEIIDKTGMPEKFGICLDTCHMFAAGYDIVSQLDRVIEEFNSILGLDKLKVIHLNDSKYQLGSRKDRHANIGEGILGIGCFKNVITHPALKEKPFLLETPGGLEYYKREIQLLKELYSN